MLLSLVLLHFLVFLNLQPVRFFNFDLSDSFGSEKTYMIVVYNEENSKDIDYKFISSINIFVVRNDKKSFLTFNPGFIINSSGRQASAIRTYLNEVGDLNNLAKLSEGLESFATIKIDKYIIVERNDFVSFMQKVNYKFKTDSLGFLTEEKRAEFKNDNYNAILNYIFPSTDEITDESIVLQQELFSQFAKSFSLLDKYKLFWDLNSIEETFFSDLSANEFITFFNRLDSSDVEFSYTSRAIRKEVFPQIAMNVNFKLLDEILGSALQDIDVVAEQPEVEVYNASSIPGQASKYSRILRNRGVSVVKVGNFFESRTENYLYIENEDDLLNFANTIDLIKEYTGNDINIIIDDYEYNRTGNIILVLGK
ncbi:MAG: hypothetical protein Kow0081_2110 [Candidatus Dojkabacteria bacterium]